MTLRQQAAQLVFPRLGSNMPPPVTAADDVVRVEALLERCPVGGLILFNGDANTTPEALAALQERQREQGRPPLLISCDVERGLGEQVRGGTVLPHALALGQVASEHTEEAARITAREMLACGVHVAFAPTADVNRERDNPIIGARAFGHDADDVSRRVRAYLRGMREEGALATAKHFPGHGGTTHDSHEALPVVKDRAKLIREHDLPPFRAAVQAGADLVMTAHVVYPGLDASGHPATASPSILQGLLRREMGFGGAVITDSLHMHGARIVGGDLGEQAAFLVRAGIDMLLDPEDAEASVEGIVRAVESGDLAAERVAEAAGRVQALRERLLRRHGEAVFYAPHEVQPRAVIGAEAHHEAALRMAEAAVRVLRDDGDVLPLPDGGEGALVLYVQTVRTLREPEVQPLGEAVARLLPRARYAEVRPDLDAEGREALLRQAEDVHTVVAALAVRPAAWHRMGLREEQSRLVRQLAERQRLVLAALGSPALLENMPTSAARLCVYSDAPPAQIALARVLAAV